MTTPANPNLSPSMSPQGPQGRMKTGVRKMNRIPLYLVLAVVLVFIGVMVKTSVDRDAEQRARDRGNVDQGGDSSMFAKSIAGLPRDGYTEATATPPERRIPVTTEGPPKPPPFTATQAAAPRRDDEAEKIRQMKMAALMGAARSKSTVATFEERKPSPGTGRTRDRTGTPADVAALRENLATMKRTAAENASANQRSALSRTPPGSYSGARPSLPPSQFANNTTGFSPGGFNGGGQYQAQAAGWDAGMDRPIAQNNDWSQFDNHQRTDRWALKSTLQAPRTAYEVRAGTVLPAVLVTGINSDLPGQIVAQISQDVYDTATHRHLLIPMGSKLIGQYQNNLVYGQSRVMVAWQRITFPDATALDIGAMPGTDEAGYSGFADQVNHHYARIFGQAILLSFITAGITVSQPQGNQGGRLSAGEVMAQQLGFQLGQVASQMLSKNLNISPTIEIRPGYRLNVMTTRDLTLDEPYTPFSYDKQRRTP